MEAEGALTSYLIWIYWFGFWENVFNFRRVKQMFELKQSKTVALQEQKIAEKLVVSHDYSNARDKLLKAQELFPALDNIESMLVVCDILCAASIKFPGIGVDCYWVLQLLPSASDSDVKAQYHKLMNLVQPIKNKFPGTEMALRFIWDAYSVLSDQDNRSAFDLYRQASWAGIGTASNHGTRNKESLPSAQNSSGCKRVSTSDNSGGSIGVGFSRSMVLKSIKGTESDTLTSQNTDQQHGKVDLQKATFSAHIDLMDSRGIDGHIESFCSPMTMHSANLLRNMSWPSKVVEKKGSNLAFYDFETNRKVEDFEVGQIWAAQHQADVPCHYAQININLKSEMNVTWLKPVPVTPDERRWCEAGLPVACGSFYLDPDMSGKRVTGPFLFSHSCSWTHGITEEQFEIYPKKGEVWAIYKDWDLTEWSLNPKTAEGCRFEIVELLTDYSKYVGALVACLIKNEGFRSVYQRCTNEGSQVSFCITPDNLYIFSHNIPTFRFMGGEMQGVVAGMLELDPLALPDDMLKNDADPDLLIKEDPRNLSSFTQNPQYSPSFKKYSENQCLKPTWSQNDFLSGQVWAVYSGTDFIPRCYTRINSVVSKSQVCVTTLEPQPILDNEIQWHKENLPIVAGIFKVGKTTMNMEMSWFSHSVKFQQSITKTLYMIYPMKGEIWAMYKNCDGKWKQSDYNNYECQIVEILSDFCEGSFMVIAKLLEVKGCLTFFLRQRVDGFELTCTMSKTDMLAFSHRIPAFIVPGVGKYGISEGSWHLEPDALPPKRGT